LTLASAWRKEAFTLDRLQRPGVVQHTRLVSGGEHARNQAKGGAFGRWSPPRS
jgi:hypothetical protein